MKDDLASGYCTFRPWDCSPMAPSPPMDNGSPSHLSLMYGPAVRCRGLLASAIDFSRDKSLPQTGD